MEHNYSLTVEKRIGKKWEVTFEKYGTNDEITARLAYELAAKYIGKAQRIGRIERRNNYDGTQTYTVYEKCGDAAFRNIYVVDLY